ncbi:methyltransferase [Dothidotthia symphoricarpi CBS 119687]|uniref:Methyltransferase n=1 Tax=Dothidotthia symphoricarpi CBS 119687 TaxID=1392245 RepID=A0A6A6AQ03_9PLEO|nr:methyltransferase [Dothidotthia symphoricarpi CBS 119687]KAF2133095.1 methyltransferase [Dothidotthia symphoricarpi CBS 119687]
MKHFCYIHRNIFPLTMAEHTTQSPEFSSHSDPPSDLKTRLKDSYDAIASQYNEWTIPHSTTRLHFLDQLLNRLPITTTSVLELGCGHGVPVTQKLLSHPNFTVTANDLSSAQIALARNTLLPNHRLTLLEGDMLALNFPLATFDAIVAMYSIIHLPRGEQVEMLRKIVAWLKPGGWLLANFGAEEVVGAEAREWLGEEKGWMFWSGWGEEGTLNKIKEAGLEVFVRETRDDEVDDARFLWVLAQKSDE